MDLPLDLLPLPWCGAGFALFGALLAWTAAGVDFPRWAREPLRQHLFFGASIAVMLLWFIRSGGAAGPGVHLLGMTALTLLLGWRLAMLGALFALVGSAVIGAAPWQTLGLSGLLLVALPIGLSHAICKLADRRLPSSMLAYILGCGFFGAIVATGLGRAAAGVLALAAGSSDWGGMQNRYLTMLPLALFPEGLVNGVAISMLVALRPGWVATLGGRRYLGR